MNIEYKPFIIKDLIEKVISRFIGYVIRISSFHMLRKVIE